MAKNLYNLTAVTTVNDSDLLHVNQGSVSSDKKVTKANLLKEVNSSITSLNNSLTNSFKVGTVTQTTGSSGHLSLGRLDYQIYVLCAWTKTAYGICIPFTDTNGNWYIKIIAWNNNSYTPIANTSVTVNYVYKDLT